MLRDIDRQVAELDRKLAALEAESDEELLEAESDEELACDLDNGSFSACSKAGSDVSPSTRSSNPSRPPLRVAKPRCTRGGSDMDDSSGGEGSPSSRTTSGASASHRSRSSSSSRPRSTSASRGISFPGKSARNLTLPPKAQQEERLDELEGCRAKARGLQTDVALRALRGDEFRALCADEEAELLARVARMLVGCWIRLYSRYPRAECTVARRVTTRAIARGARQTPALSAHLLGCMLWRGSTFNRYFTLIYGTLGSVVSGH